MNERRAASYHAQVWQHDESRRFLAARHLDHSTVSRFRLGYVGEPVEGERTRIHGQPVRGCLAIPYEDGVGRVRQVRFRPLYQSDQKYLTAPGEDAHLFALRATNNKEVYVAEGEIDAVSLWQVGLRAVGLPGANNWKPEWRWLFRDCERVVLCLDPDAAGIRGAQALYQGLSLVTSVDVARFPRGHDCNDVLVRFGPRNLREAVGAR